MQTMNELDRLNFADLRAYVENPLGTEPWLTVYEYTERDSEKIGYFCALVPLEKVPDCLGERSWDLLIGHGFPGRMYWGDQSQYLRFGNDNGVEPLVFLRSFPSSKRSYLEVSEEFRHFHNLYEDRKNDTFVAFDEAGDEEDVIRITREKIQILAKDLRDYLAERDMALLLFFEFDRWSSKTLDELCTAKSDQERSADNFRYGWWVDTWPGVPTEVRKTFARMMGKKIVYGTPNYDTSLDARWRNRKYEEFIIGVDENGTEITHTCDEDKLSNYFGRNPGAPHYLTLVFFRKAVLNKYYSNPSEYTVEDGGVSRVGNWSLRVDNNHSDYVVVYLGDLGHLAYKEQLYWKSFNVVPDGSLSEVAFRRGMLGQWIDPNEPALRFKLVYQAVPGPVASHVRMGPV